MPINDLPTDATLEDTVAKVNEVVDFLNNIQKSGSGQYMIWTGDGIVPDKPTEDSSGGV